MPQAIDQELIRKRIAYVMETGQPLRPAYSELQLLLTWVGVLSTCSLLLNACLVFYVLRHFSH